MLKTLKDGRFARLWTGQTISFLGDWLNIAAVLSVLAFKWQVSALTMSLFGLTMAVPMLVLGPVAGVFADRWNRKTMMIVFDLIRAAAVLGYLVATNVVQIYAVALVLSVSGVFFSPSRTSVIRQIVPEEDLMAANTLSTLSLQLTKIIGPAIGGVIVATLGESVCFWANSVSFIVSALFIASVALPDHRTEATVAAAGAARVAKSSFFSELKAGVAHVYRTKPILYSIGLVVLCIFCVSMFDAVAGVLIRENFGTDPRTMGLVIGVVGLGTTISAMWVGSRAKGYRRLGLTAVGVLWMGLALGLMVAFSAYGGSLAVPAAIVFAGLVGAGISFVIIPATTTAQVETPPEMMGRVGGACDSLISGASTLAYPVGGAVSTAIGATNLTFGAAVLLAIIGVAALAWLPGARPLRESASSAALAGGNPQPVATPAGAR